MIAGSGINIISEGSPDSMTIPGEVIGMIALISFFVLVWKAGLPYYFK